MTTPIASPDVPAVSRAPILLIVLVSYLIIVLNISVVITALPSLQAELGLSTAGVSWVQNSYTLAFGGLLMLGARAGDVLGRRRMFMLGVGIFTAASLAIGMAPAGSWIVAARALQGAGAAILAPSALALIPANFPAGPERTRAVAYYGAVAGIGSSTGMVLGGVLTHAISWRVGFFINLPIGLGLIIGARRFLAETELRAGKLDWTGGLTSTLGKTALVFGIVRAAGQGWADPATITTLATGIALLALFVLRERRASQPIMPLRLFASRERSGAYAARILFLGAMMGFWFFITQFLQKGLGFTAFQGGLGFLPMTIPSFIAALCVPWATRRIGNARLLAAGVLLATIGMGWLSLVDADSAYLTGIALPMILVGIGQGAALSPLTASGIAGTAAEDAGAASGVVNVAHQVGSSLGLAILVTIAAGVMVTGYAEAELLAQRTGAALTGATMMLALALLLVWFLIVRSGDHQRPPAIA